MVRCLQTLAVICVGLCVLLSQTVSAEVRFPQRKVTMGGGYVIEYSEGDEAYAQALVRYLPLEIPTPQDIPAVPFSLRDLRERRAEIVARMAEQLGVPAIADNTVASFGTLVDVLLHASESLKPARLALWRKAEIDARLRAGQTVAGFSRDAEGELVFSLDVSFQFAEGESTETAVARMRAEVDRLTWPIKIGEDPALSAETDIRAQVVKLREDFARLAALVSSELQRIHVHGALHEIAELTLVNVYLRSADRRWFCEGVANYAASNVLRALTGSVYYDLDADVARYAGLRDRIDLPNWPVVGDTRGNNIPPEVTLASYAFATQAVVRAFEGLPPDTLARVLAEVGKTPIARADMNTVYTAYRRVTGRELRDYLPGS